MEEDKVCSEVNSVFYQKGPADVSGEEISSQINNTEHDNELKIYCSQSIDCKETNEYSCQLGAHGQVVLWSQNSETVVSRFEFVYDSCLVAEVTTPNVDKDGDLEVIRKSDLLVPCTIMIEHRQESSLDLVGEQIWRGSLFLADFILDNPQEFKEKNILEVASGVGLASIIAGMFAKKVISTDVTKGDILDLINKNFSRNYNIIKSEFHIKELDFLNTDTIDAIDSLLGDVNVVLAADVIYHNDLTDKFFEAVLCIMKKGKEKTLYISLEKRYVFTLKDMDTVAPCYEHFLTRLKWLQQQEPNHISWKVEELDINFTQRMVYEKTRHVVLWRIKSQFK